MLAPGWRCTLMMIAGVVFAQAASLVFSGPLTIVATSDKSHRRAVAIGDDQGAVLIGAGDLVVGIDGQRLRRAVEIALRRIDVEIAERGADIVDVQPV